MAGGSTLKKSPSQKSSSQGARLGSEICEGHIEALRHHRLLPPASQVLVRIPDAETAPTPAMGEVVVFNEHFYRGFGLPASAFFSEWLHFFGLQPHHLAPNAILQLSAFVVLCQGFVGIEPRVDLWHSLFFFKQQSIAMEKSEIEKLAGPRPMTPCGAALVHHRSKSGFPQLLLHESIKQWQRGFFYVKNADPAQDALNMPPFNIDPPTKLNWVARTPKPIPEVAQICAHLEILEKSGLLGRDLLTTMMFKKLQGSLRPPAPDVDVSDASEIKDEGVIKSRSDSSTGSENAVESEGIEPSCEYSRPSVADWTDDDDTPSFLSDAAFEEDSDGVEEEVCSLRMSLDREAEDVEEDTASAAERASWAAADAAQRELEEQSKRRWDTTAGKTAEVQPCPSRAERPVEKCTKARHDPSARARVEEPASEAAPRHAPRAEGAHPSEPDASAPVDLETIPDSPRAEAAPDTQELVLDARDVAPDAPGVTMDASEAAHPPPAKETNQPGHRRSRPPSRHLEPAPSSSPATVQLRRELVAGSGAGP
ncbi:hypothetical protein D1007_21417 [Hordeum vulgare]|nr:hypothetical protein D1007_21417 [Hordeum vulgare]